MSSLETLILPYILKDLGEISFVIKEELLRKKYFKHIMRGLRCIPMTRTNPRQDLQTLFKESKNLIQEKTNIVIFPQKTRSVTFDAESFNSIGCKLAAKNNISIQPIALKTDFLTSSKLLKDFGNVNRKKNIFLTIGKPIPVTKENQKEIHTQCIDFIDKNLKQTDTKNLNQ